VEFLDRYRDEFEEWNMYMTDERPTGVPAAQLSVHVRLEGVELDRKLTALRAMASQTSGLIEMLGAEAYAEQVREEWFIDAHGARTSRSAANAVGSRNRLTIEQTGATIVP
jgi:hypothetical protein